MKPIIWQMSGNHWLLEAPKLVKYVDQNLCCQFIKHKCIWIFYLQFTSMFNWTNHNKNLLKNFPRTEGITSPMVYIARGDGSVSGMHIVSNFKNTKIIY